MSRSSHPRRGRPRREYRIRVRAERRAEPDYDKLARALLEHAAMQARQTTTPDAEDTEDAPGASPADDGREPEERS